MVPDSLEEAIRLHPETLSPDMDGFDDLMTVTYRFSESGHTASLTVYDTYGRRVRTIARNALCGTEGFFRWNGLDEKNGRLPSGPYYMVMETIDRKGAKKVWRRPLVIAYRR